MSAQMNSKDSRPEFFRPAVRASGLFNVAGELEPVAFSRQYCCLIYKAGENGSTELIKTKLKEAAISRTSGLGLYAEDRMKIRQDFVTNSSSTCFIISLKNDFTGKNFLEALEVKGNKAVETIFHDIFEVIRANKKLFSVEKPSDSETFDEYLDYLDLDDDELEVIKKLQADKRKFYTGYFDDTSSGMEYYLCQERIIISNDKIFFATPER
jgi:hypothetical protein